MFLVNKVPSVFVVVSLVLLANAQKTSNSLRDVGKFNNKYIL